MIENLIVISDPVSEAREMRQQKEGVRGLRTYTPFSISCWLAEGVHKINPPAEFLPFEETLVLGDHHPGGDSYAKMFRSIFAFDWGKEQVQVFPQDWFNESNYDFGYQWITRVERRPDGRIVGDGIRLGSFELDETNKRVKRWTSQDPFYMLD
jgi:hypothetical protein